MTCGDPPLETGDRRLAAVEGRSTPCKSSPDSPASGSARSAANGVRSTSVDPTVARSASSRPITEANLKAWPAPIAQKTRSVFGTRSITKFAIEVERIQTVLGQVETDVRSRKTFGREGSDGQNRVRVRFERAGVRIGDQLTSRPHAVFTASSRRSETRRSTAHPSESKPGTTTGENGTDPQRSCRPRVRA